MGKLLSKDLRISMRLDKLSLNGKAPLVYAIHDNEGKIISRVCSPYRLLPYDFIGRESKPTRRAIENQCIKEELGYFKSLCEKFEFACNAIESFKRYINERDEI